MKHLLGLELTAPGFGHTALTGFRDRLLAHCMEARGLDLLLERLAELGLDPGMWSTAMPSTTCPFGLGQYSTLCSPWFQPRTA